MANEIVELDQHALQDLEIERTKIVFGHTHELRLFRFQEKKTESCICCNKQIRDPVPAYCCIECNFYVHICCGEIPEIVERSFQRQHPFHMQHLLHTTRMSKDESRNCKACTKSIRGICLSCRSGDFDLHVSCIKPSPRALKHKCHNHSLFYFKDKSLSLLKCCVCNETCEAPFYRCVDCDMNFHLECIPIPGIVLNAKSHPHPVMLLSSLILVHDGEEYCCDICDQQGNAEHHGYYCDECKFIAHVECLLLEDDSSWEIEKADDSEDKSGHENMNSKRQRALKHECHEHNLTYFVQNGDLRCKECSEKCKGGFYHCPECGISFHVDCIPLPRTLVLMEHTRFRLNFILLDLVIEDHPADHRCEFCKEKLNSQDHVYYCQESNFFAHVECLFAEGNIITSKKLLFVDPEEMNTIEADSGIKPNLTKPKGGEDENREVKEDVKKKKKGQAEDGHKGEVKPSTRKGNIMSSKKQLTLDPMEVSTIDAESSTKPKKQPHAAEDESREVQEDEKKEQKGQAEDSHQGQVKPSTCKGNIISSKKLLTLDPEDVITNIDADSSTKPNLTKEITSLEKTQQPKAADDERREMQEDDQKKQQKGEAEDCHNEQVKPTWLKEITSLEKTQQPNAADDERREVQEDDQKKQQKGEAEDCHNEQVKPTWLKEITSLEKTQQPNAADDERREMQEDDQKKLQKGEAEDCHNEQVKPTWLKEITSLEKTQQPNAADDERREVQEDDQKKQQKGEAEDCHNEQVKPTWLKEITSLEKTQQQNAADDERREMQEDDQKKQQKGEAEDCHNEQVKPTWLKLKELADKGREVVSDPEKRGKYFQNAKDALKFKISKKQRNEQVRSVKRVDSKEVQEDE